MQSTLISRESDPHDAFMVEPDVVLAARADHAPPDPISSLLTPPIHPAPELAARPAPELAVRPTPELAVRPVPELAARPAPELAARPGPPPLPPVEPPLPPVDMASRAPANNDIQIPRDIHVAGQRPPRGKWAGRVTIGFLFALGSAAAAEGWNHYGDTAGDTVKAVVANWTPFTLAAQRTAATSAAAQPAVPVAAADQTSAQPAPTAQPAPAAQPAQDTASQASAQPAPATQPAQDTTSQGSASQDPAPQGTASQATASTIILHQPPPHRTRRSRCNRWLRTLPRWDNRSQHSRRVSSSSKPARTKWRSRSRATSPRLTWPRLPSPEHRRRNLHNPFLWSRACAPRSPPRFRRDQPRRRHASHGRHTRHKPPPRCRQRSQRRQCRRRNPRPRRCSMSRARKRSIRPTAIR